MSKNIVLITKLTTGEEIISDTQVVKVGDVPMCLMIKPCQLVQVPTETGGVGVTLVPWMLYAKGHNVPMPLDMIMTQVEVETDLLNKYNSIFGSGIQVPDNKILVN